MTSLQASLPDTASGLWRMDREYGPEEARVKHVVIHEAHLREVPDRHVVYRVDVFTQERNWCVYRRYSEFLKLHQTLSDRFRMLRGSFPPKQMSGNLSPAVIDERRSALEHYLLRIVNCHNREVASCPSVLKFLDLYSNDVYHVTAGLSRFTKNFGEAVIFEGHSFVVSPTQLFCIAKRLRIPNLESDYKADNVFCDLSSLYDFLSRLKSVTVKPSSTQDNGVRCELSLMKSLTELNIVTYSVSLLKGLSTVQLQLERLTANHAVTAMKDILIDSVLERKTQPRPPAPSEAENSWRSNFNTKAFNNAFTIHPWISLTFIDLTHNTIRQLDDSFSLLPNLQELNLSYNNIEVLDIGFVNPALSKLTCSHSHTIKIICKTHENLAELILDNNMITELSGFNKLAHLKYLNLSSNALASLDVVATLTELPRLTDIVLKDNPLSKKSKYRKQVLSLFAQMASRDDIMVDGKPFSDKEKSKARSTRVKSSVPHVPVDLPFFSGSSADQLPPAFMARKDDMWNTILHDTDPSADISAESSPPLSEGEEMGVEGALMSPQSSTRSTPRVYNWDPAEAFAKSLPKERSTTAADYVICKSPHGSSDCLDDDYASSCCESGSCTGKEERSHSMKDFNNSYYSITGSGLYSTERPRINPFGQPSPASKVIHFAELDIQSGTGSDSLTSVSPGEVLTKREFTSEEDFSSLQSKESGESEPNLKNPSDDQNLNIVNIPNTSANTDEFTLSKPDFFDQLMTGTLPPPSQSSLSEEEITQEKITLNDETIVILTEKSEKLTEKSESVSEISKEDDQIVAETEVEAVVEQESQDQPDVQRDQDISDVQQDQDISDVQQDQDISDVQRVQDISDVQQDQDISDVQQVQDISDVQQDHDISDVQRDHDDISDVQRVQDISDVQQDASPCLESQNDVDVESQNDGDVESQNEIDALNDVNVESQNDVNLYREQAYDDVDNDVVKPENVSVCFDELEKQTPPQDPIPSDYSDPLTSTPLHTRDSPDNLANPELANFLEQSPASPDTLGHSHNSQSPIYAEGSSSDELVSSMLTQEHSPLEQHSKFESAFTSGISISDMYDDNCVSDESDELDFTNSKIKIQF